MKREEMNYFLKSFFENQADTYGLEMVFLYGSWGRGIPRPDSDIDLAVVFSSEQLTNEEKYECITDISLFLSSELKREVNIIQIHKDSWKPMLYYNVVFQGLPLYIKNYDKYVRLKSETLYQMEDYKIFGLDWQFKAAAKSLEALKDG